MNEPQIIPPSYRQVANHYNYKSKMENGGSKGLNREILESLFVTYGIGSLNREDPRHTEQAFIVDMELTEIFDPVRQCVYLNVRMLISSLRFLSYLPKALFFDATFTIVNNE